MVAVIVVGLMGLLALLAPRYGVDSRPDSNQRANPR